MAPQRLTDTEIASLTPPGWTVSHATLQRGFKFRDFDAAWAFMAEVAALAKAQDHHPDWSNSYNRVEVTLTTHDAGGITQADITLAEAIGRLREALPTQG